MHVSEFHYRMLRRVRALRPGQHSGTYLGDGQLAESHVDIVNGRDPRRLDLFASARDPYGRLLVRMARQHASVPVYLLADLSASMSAQGQVSKLNVLAEFTQSLALSVYRSGDMFAFFGFDERIRRDFFCPLSRAKGIGPDIANRLRRAGSGGGSAAGLVSAVQRVTKRDTLVFLVSDFFFDVALIETALNRLEARQVVPVVLTDSADTHPRPGFGLAQLMDAESARERTVIVWRGLQERLSAQSIAHGKRVAEVFRRRGISPLRLNDGFNAEHVTRYFHD